MDAELRSVDGGYDMGGWRVIPYLILAALALFVLAWVVHSALELRALMAP